MADPETLGDRPLGGTGGDEEQHVGLTAGEAELHQPLPPRTVDRRRVAEHVGEPDRVAVGLDQKRPGVGEQVTLAVAEVMVASDSERSRGHDRARSAA